MHPYYNEYNFLKLFFLQLREIARVKAVSLQSLFQRFKKPISEFMMEAVHKVQLSPGPGIKTTIDIIRETANAFQFRDIKAFLAVSKYRLGCSLQIRGVYSVLLSN